MNARRFSIVAFCICTGIAAVYTQTLPRYDGRPIKAGARIAALGEASVGEAIDASSLYWNPAALSFIQQQTVVLTSVREGSGEILDNTLSSPPFSVGPNQVAAVGISGSYYGNEWYRPYFSYQGIDLAYSIRLHQAVSIGATMNVRYGKSMQSSLWAGSGSIGGFYAPSPGLSYGVVFDGIGMGISYSNSNGHPALDYNRHLEQSIHVGAAFRFPAIYRAPYIDITLESQKVLGPQKRLIYRGGIETYPTKIISLRAGIIASSKATIGTIGAGLKLGRFDIDYALSPSSALQRFHQVSFSYNTNH